MNHLATAGNAVQGIGGAALFIALIVLYILPSLIASRRRVRNLTAVVLVNVLLGWTVVLWVVALTMALNGPNRRWD